MNEVRLPEHRAEVEASPRWRTGRKVGRTLYHQVGAEPSDADVLIGLMDTRELAAQVVEAVNAAAEGRP